MPETKAVVLANAVPPVDAAYHCKLVPVAVKLATVEAEQKVCATAVGAVAGVMVTATAVLALSQVPVVCET